MNAQFECFQLQVESLVITPISLALVFVAQNENFEIIFFLFQENSQFCIYTWDSDSNGMKSSMVSMFPTSLLELLLVSFAIKMGSIII